MVIIEVIRNYGKNMPRSGFRHMPDYKRGKKQYEKFLKLARPQSSNSERGAKAPSGEQTAQGKALFDAANLTEIPYVRSRNFSSKGQMGTLWGLLTILQLFATVQGSVLRGRRDLNVSDVELINNFTSNYLDVSEGLLDLKQSEQSTGAGRPKVLAEVSETEPYPYKSRKNREANKRGVQQNLDKINAKELEGNSDKSKRSLKRDKNQVTKQVEGFKLEGLMDVVISGADLFAARYTGEDAQKAVEVIVQRGDKGAESFVIPGLELNVTQADKPSIHLLSKPHQGILTVVTPAIVNGTSSINMGFYEFNSNSINELQNLQLNHSTDASKGSFNYTHPISVGQSDDLILVSAASPASNEGTLQVAWVVANKQLRVDKDGLSKKVKEFSPISTRKGVVDYVLFRHDNEYTNTNRKNSVAGTNSIHFFDSKLNNTLYFSNLSGEKGSRGTQVFSIDTVLNSNQLDCITTYTSNSSPCAREHSKQTCLVGSEKKERACQGDPYGTTTVGDINARSEKTGGLTRLYSTKGQVTASAASLDGRFATFIETNNSTISLKLLELSANQTITLESEGFANLRDLQLHYNENSLVVSTWSGDTYFSNRIDPDSLNITDHYSGNVADIKNFSDFKKMILGQKPGIETTTTVEPISSTTVATTATTPSTKPPTTTQETPASTNTAAIWGSTIGVLGAVGIAAGCLICYLRRRRQGYRGLGVLDAVFSVVNSICQVCQRPHRDNGRPGSSSAMFNADGRTATIPLSSFLTDNTDSQIIDHRS